MAAELFRIRHKADRLTPGRCHRNKSKRLWAFFWFNDRIKI
jgi:hypothetical protein